MSTIQEVIWNIQLVLLVTLFLALFVRLAMSIMVGKTFPFTLLIIIIRFIYVKSFNILKVSQIGRKSWAWH